MLEKEIERKLVSAVRKLGGLCFKFVSPGCNGVPDRLIILPHGKVAFAELKAPGEQLRALQVIRKRQIEVLGVRVYCIDNAEMIDEVLNEIQERV